MFPNFGFAASASFNNNSADYPTVRAANYTLYPNSTTNWSTYTAAEPGQIIGVAIYYHNTTSVTAENTIIRVNRPSGTSNLFTITGSVGASNAPTVTGAATVVVSSNETLTYIPGSVKWFPNHQLSEYSLPNGQDGSEIFGSGLNIGNITGPGWEQQGSVVLQFQISKAYVPPQQSQPSVTTNSATNIGQNSATLNGYVNPNGTTDTSRWFEWGTSSGNLNFSTNHNNQGSSASSFSGTISGLSAGTTYYFRAVAQNSAGTVQGSILSFRTETQTSVKPSVSTYSATDIDESSATLNGYLYPNDTTDTEHWFEWGLNSINLTPTNRIGQISNGSFEETITGLEAGTTYYFRAVAQNSAGTSYGSIRSFRTDSASVQNQPSVSTSNASNIGQNSATLNGYVNPNGTTDTSRWFEWGTNSSNLNYSTSRINQGSSASSFNETISGLSSNTTYYFRAVAENSAGTVQGSVLSFRTGSQPTTNRPSVSTSAASNINGNSATLGGYLYTNGSSDTNRWFEWGTNSGNLNRSTSRISQSYDGAFSESISGLSANTTYYFRAVGENSGGVDYGSTRSFRTETGQTADAPDVTTSSATNIYEDSARLNGYVDPNDSTDTTYWFEWGTSSSNLSRSTNRFNLGSSATNVSETISNLSTDTTYYFRVAAENSAGTDYGSVRSFRTGSFEDDGSIPSVSTSNASYIDSDSATLNGYVDPHGTSGTYRWFEWGTNSGSFYHSTSRRSQGSSASNFDDVISGLSSNTTYYFRAAAENSAGMDYGNIRSFRTEDYYSDPYDDYDQMPTVITYSPTSVGQNSVTFNGYVNPNGYSNTYRWFEYYAVGTGILSTSQVYHGSGSSNFSQYVSGLSANTNYFVRAVARNSYGTTYGSYLSFSTGSGGTYYGDSTSQQPLALTNSATNIYTTSAQLNGLALNGSNVSTNVWFEWGTNVSSLGNQTSLASIGYAASSPFTANLTGLVPGATYYFRAVAQNAYGTGRGVVLSFRASGGTVYQPPAAVPSGITTSLSLRKEVENLSFPNGTKTSVAAAAGNTVRFNITVTNTGGAEADNVTVTDELSSFLDFENATDGGTWNEASHKVSWRLDNLKSGEKKTMSINARAKELPNNVVAENEAEAIVSGRTRTSNIVIVLINTQHVILSITNEDEKVSPGENIDYTISYKNEGESEVKNLLLTVVLPNGMEFKSSDFNFSKEDNILRLNLPDLRAKEIGEATFRANVSGEFTEETSVTTNALLVYTDLLDNNQRGVNAFVINVVRAGIGSFVASIFGFLPGNLPFLLLVLFILIIAIYIIRRLIRKPAGEALPA